MPVQKYFNGMRTMWQIGCKRTIFKENAFHRVPRIFAGGWISA